MNRGDAEAAEKRGKRKKIQKQMQVTKSTK